MPPPPPVPESLALSAHDQDSLSRLPQRPEFVVEMVIGLCVQMPLLNEKKDQPCLARLGVIVDCASGYVFSGPVMYGTTPLYHAVGQTLVQALRRAKMRPGSIHVQDDRLAAVLRSTCDTLGIQLKQVPLALAPQAWVDLEEFFGRQRPR